MDQHLHQAPPAVSPSGTVPGTGTVPQAPGRRPRRRIPKPQLDRVLEDKGLLIGILLLPLLAVVGFFAQFLELLYYAGLLVYGIVMSPYWSVRALWRAFGPATTPADLARRAEARRTVKTTAGCLGWILGLVIVVLGVMVWIGLKMEQ